jgi:uncharacterized protein
MRPAAAMRKAAGWAMRALIRAYQLFLAPVLPPSCRYAPSCSHYAAEAIAVHGPWRGLGLAVHRLLRCHPWGGSGYDPVPAAPASRRDPLVKL